MGGSRSSTWLKKSGAADTLSVSRWLSSEECREEKDCRDLHDSLRALPAVVLEYYLPRIVQYYSTLVPQID